MKYQGLPRTQLSATLLSLVLAACAAQGGKAVPDRPADSAPTSPVKARVERPAAGMAAPTEAEKQAGIQIVRIGATAQGGLIDARFKVLDAARATALLANPANAPQLVTADKPPLVAPHHALKGSRFAKDQVFVILYPNMRGAVQPGVPVIVAMGQTKLGPVTAR